MPTKHVYLIRPSVEETRPYIDFTLPENSAVHSIKSYAVVTGKAPVDQYVPIRFTVRHPEADDWDFYPCPGTMNIISQRVANAIGAYTTRCFNLLECYINDTRFYFLGEKDTFDCLDHEASTITWHDWEPKEIHNIELYRFKKDVIPDPMLCMIPEGRFGVFATDTIRELVETHGFKGLPIFRCRKPHVGERPHGRSRWAGLVTIKRRSLRQWV